MLIVIALMGIEIKGLRDDNKKLLTNEGTYKAQIQELAGHLEVKDKTIALCDARTKELRDQADKRAKDVERARSEARKAAEENFRLIDEILALKPTDENLCKQAEDVYIRYSKIRRDRDARGLAR